jgi:stage II sporulation protein D
MGRLVCLSLTCLVAVGCFGSSAGPKLPAPDAALPSQLRIQVLEGGKPVIRAVALEEYVRATALSEFAPASGDEAIVERMLEVQAIISRTFAASHVGRHRRDGFDLCATTHCQLFEPGRLKTSRWAPAASLAVERTEGVVVLFEGVPAQALFHADCGGHTSSATSIWGGQDRSYLSPREDGGPASKAHSTWEYEVSIDALTRALNTDPKTRLSGKLHDVVVVERDGGGRAVEIAVRGSNTFQVRGEEFRQVLSRAFGPRTIKSTYFQIKRSGSKVTFSGRGYGHGVGLCQAGALARLTAGAKPKDVLKFYYPGTQLRGSQVRGETGNLLNSSSHRQRY